MNLNEAKQILKENGYICEDYDTMTRKAYGLDKEYNITVTDDAGEEKYYTMTGEQLLDLLGNEAFFELTHEGSFDTGNNAYYHIDDAMESKGKKYIPFV